MKERKGFTHRITGLVQDREDGLVSMFSNEITKVEDLVEWQNGEKLQEGDQLYLAPEGRITPYKLAKYDHMTLDEQLKEHNLMLQQTGEVAFLAKGKLKINVAGVQEGKEKEVNILIVRKA